MTFRRAALGVALVAVAVASAAAEPPAPAAPEPRAGRETPEPRVQRIVDEDDHVRIEELRVRGESQRVVVTPKGSSAKEYEIVPSTGAIDPSLGTRRTARERMWRVLSF